MAALTDAAEDAAFEAAAEVARSLTPSTDDRLNSTASTSKVRAAP